MPIANRPTTFLRPQAGISVRQWIRWLPEAGQAPEPTSTLVLTSPTRRFVDIRVLKNGSEDKGQNTETLSGQQLDWAFAGISSSRVNSENVKWSKWVHTVDSRTQNPETVVDEGTILPQDDGHTLESGRMINPSTGKLTDYEELWVDEEVEGIPDSSVSSRPTARCVVYELKGNERGEGGMVVFLGRYCQGIVRIGDRLAVERWQWTGEWRQTCGFGDLWMPCAEAMTSEASIGTTIEREGRIWTVVEASNI
ncbi:hypothetical protein GGR57DRAFT_512872 [Xylariaceae sp. FL1272]|nr:hypothetical protein GGR57DRAFT_512872 [Xylariaceae sp. FL1272]